LADNIPDSSGKKIEGQKLLTLRAQKQIWYRTSCWTWQITVAFIRLTMHTEEQKTHYCNRESAKMFHKTVPWYE